MKIHHCAREIKEYNLGIGKKEGGSGGSIKLNIPNRELLFWKMASGPIPAPMRKH